MSRRRASGPAATFACSLRSALTTRCGLAVSTFQSARVLNVGYPCPNRRYTPPAPILPVSEVRLPGETELLPTTEPGASFLPPWGPLGRIALTYRPGEALSFEWKPTHA